MVATIKKPSEDSLTILKKIQSERVAHKAFYTAIEMDWTASANIYIANQGDPSGLIPLVIRKYTATDDEALKRKKSLINLYAAKQDNFLHAILHSMRRKHGLIFCPLCGEAGSPDTLDHYLPKDVFPEFSVLLINLVPICLQCQLSKGTKYKNSSGKKYFLHPYFDEENQQLYQINFSPPYESPIFSIVVNSALKQDMYDLVIDHIEGIKLNDRFKNFFVTKYTHLIRTAKNSRGNNQNTLRLVLNNRLEGEIQKSINCWEAIFYQSVLSDSDLMNYLQHGKLPDYF